MPDKMQISFECLHTKPMPFPCPIVPENTGTLTLTAEFLVEGVRVKDSW